MAVGAARKPMLRWMTDAHRCLSHRSAVASCAVCNGTATRSPVAQGPLPRGSLCTGFPLRRMHNSPGPRCARALRTEGLASEGGPHRGGLWAPPHSKGGRHPASRRSHRDQGGGRPLRPGRFRQYLAVPLPVGGSPPACRSAAKPPAIAPSQRGTVALHAPHDHAGPYRPYPTSSPPRLTSRDPVRLPHIPKRPPLY